MQGAIAQVLVTDVIVKQPISKVLSQWSEKYGADFAFDSFELTQYTFTGEFEAIPLDAALDQILIRTPFRSRWLNGTYVIIPTAELEKEKGKQSSASNVISGLVTDRLNGESLPFASVAALVDGISTTADADGSFNLIRNAENEFDTLVVVYLGYVTGRFPFNWNELNTRFRVELVPAGALLPDVEVRATSVKPMLFESEPATFIINPNLTGLRYGVGEADVFRPAQFAPGISAVLENSNGLFIRGSSSDQSQLLFDGFNIYHQDHFFGMFSSLNALAVKSMRIHKCPSDPSLGGRVAGTIEVIGKEGDLRKPSGLLDMGTMSISGSFETPLDTTGKASLFLAGRRSITEWVKGPAYQELFRTLYSASIVSRNNDAPGNTDESFDPELLFQDFNAKFTYKASWKNHYNVSFYASRDDLNFSYADTSSAESVNVSDIRYSDEAGKVNRGVSARWIHRLSPRLEVHTSAGFSAFQGVYFSTDSIRNNLFAIDSTRFSYHDVLLNDWTATHRWQYSSSRHTFTWGAMINRIATNEKFRTQSESPLMEESSGSIISIFTGDEWRSARWMVKPVLRLNHYSREGSKLYLEPKLTARYNLHDQIFFLKASATRSVQFLQRITNQSLYQNVPDRWQLAGASFPVLMSDQAILGLNWTPSEWNVDLEAYTKRTRGQVLNATAGQYTNSGFSGYYTGVAYVRGVDAAIQWERPPHRIMASFSAMWAMSDYEGFEQQQIQESHIRGTEGKMVYEWRKGPWNASLLALAAQGAPYTEWLGAYQYSLPDGSSNIFPVFGGYNRALTNPYFRADIAVGYRWQWLNARWQVNISVYNVLNTPNYRAMQYSVVKLNEEELSVREREIRMLGRIPSINLTCQF
jgi:ferric enterobactin receptor